MSAPITPAQMQTLLQWLSPAYPVGGFAYSHGLEAAITAGDILDVGALQDWLEAVLAQGSGRNDVILLAAAYRAKDAKILAEVAETATAYAASAERLLETTAQGAAFCRAYRAIWPGALPDMAFPVAIGAAARHLDLPLTELAILYLQAFTSNLISAAVRFMPLGQTEGQHLLAGLAPHIETVATAALTTDLDDLGGCAFRSDLAAMQHETMTVRIFRS